MKNKFFYMISTILALFASVFVLTASQWWAHQPKVPQELLKRNGDQS